MEATYPVLAMLINQNAPSYNKYRNEENTIIYVQSASFTNFTLNCSITLRKYNFSRNKEYVVGMGAVVEIDVSVNTTQYA
jgi:hypothetical protein